MLATDLQLYSLQFTNMKVFIVLFAVLAATGAKRLFHNDQVLRAYPTQEQKDVLANVLPKQFPNLDFWTRPKGIAPVDIHVSRTYVGAVKVFLTRMRINHEVFIEDVQAHVDNEKSDRPAQMSLAGFDYDVYHTFDEIQAWVDNIASAHPEIASKVEVGGSFEGRTFSGIKLSTSDNNPAFVINCGLHTREWVSPASCLYAVKYFVEAQPGSEEMNILNGVDVYIIPISNPDGYVYSWTDDRMWRKTRSTNQPSCVGVDPNSNWDSHWSGEGSSSSPCNDAYYGPSVWSEVEIVAQRDFVQSIPNVKAYIDIHSYNQHWMYAYGYTVAPPADITLLNEIGSASVAAIQAVHGNSFEQGSVSQVISVDSGTTADYFYDNVVKCSFAAELRDTGRYGFLLPEVEIAPASEESFAGLKVIASYVLDNRC